MRRTVIDARGNPIEVETWEPPQRKKATKVFAPLPLSWLEKVPRSYAGVALANLLHYQRFKNRGRLPIKLGNGLVGRYGISRQRKCYVLKQFEGRGLIRYEQLDGNLPLITWMAD